MSECSRWLADEAETLAFGARLAPGLVSRPGLCVFLQGDLGAGKTTLTRGILTALGHQGAVKSPTYTLVETYELKAARVYHFDLYRLGHPEELDYMGIRDYFDGRSLCLVEWPSRGEGVLPVADIHIWLQVQDAGRLVKLEPGTDAGAAVCAALMANNNDD